MKPRFPRPLPRGIFRFLSLSLSPLPLAVMVTVSLMTAGTGFCQTAPVPVPVPVSGKPAMETPLKAGDLDEAAFSEWVNGAEKPLAGPDQSQKPQWALWTDST
ncbi:MAG: hypothetical protein EOP86_18650, partial [Verrucomicrobiaceae bacterium]